MLQVSLPKTQRFFPVLGKALSVGLESNVSESDYLQYLRENAELPSGFSYELANPRQKNFSLRHPAASNDVNLLNDIFLPLEKSAAPPLVLTFAKLPENLPARFRKINLRRKSGYDCHDISGFACGRFTMFVDHPEIKAFGIGDQKTIGYLNLDCLSRTSFWNPLYLKYHLQAPLKNIEFGYLEIDVRPNPENDLTVIITRVSAANVPEYLKNAKTFPR